MERQRALIEQKIRSYRQVVVSLDRFITQEREVRQIMASTSYEIVEKVVGPLLDGGSAHEGQIR